VLPYSPPSKYDISQDGALFISGNGPSNHHAFKGFHRCVAVNGDSSLLKAIGSQ
jgi:hypothetical protein